MNKKIGILDKTEYGKGGIDTFIRNTNPYLIDNFEETERINYQGIRDSYPLSRTIEKFTIKRRLEKKLKGFDKVFVPSQTMFYVDPENLDAELITYVHDILPITSFYKTYSDDSLGSRLEGYLGLVTAARYTKMLAKTGHVIVPSQVTKKEILERTSFNGRVDVVKQGVDHLPELRPRGSRPIDLLYVGDLLDRKNPELIKESFEKAEEKGFNVAWVNHEDLDLPGEGYVNISDWYLAELYHNTKYYLHPSFAEGMGRGPLEAQRYGAIPLARDIPVNNEFLGEKNRCWRSIEAVSDVTDVLGGDPDFYRDAAVENSERYKWSETRERLAEVLLDK